MMLGFTHTTISEHIADLLPPVLEPVSQVATDGGASRGTVAALVALEARVEALAVLVARYVPLVATHVETVAGDVATALDHTASAHDRVVAVGDAVRTVRAAHDALHNTEKG